MKELALQVEDERRQSDQYKDQVCFSRCKLYGLRKFEAAGFYRIRTVQHLQCYNSRDRAARLCVTNNQSRDHLCVLTC